MSAAAVAALVACAALASSPLAAQSASGGAALVIESVGGTVGSGAGLALGLVIAHGDDCTTDDIGCYVESAAIAALVSTAGAAIGTTLAGRMADTRPSGIGAILGSIAGAAAGIGMAHLIAEELDLTRSDLALAFSYSISQGIVTAIGSRIGALLRS